VSGCTGAADGQKRQRGSTRTENSHGRTRTDNPRVASSIPSLARKDVTAEGGSE